MKPLRWRILIAAALCVPTALGAQQAGTVTGTVTDAATQRPLVGVQVSIVGTQIGALTNQQGRFLFPSVPPGPREVRATLIGYAQATQPVIVAAGETVTVSFQLSQQAVAIEGVVVTATGETQRRREVGNSVGNIDVADVELAAVSNFAQLLQGRSPGVTVTPSGGTTGGSQRIRIRGSNSVSLSNEPLVIIDGVRVNNSPQGMSIEVGGQDISRLNDLNPDEIENIEVLRGPAAAALYGTAAANGVIQITTRRGRAGATRWSVHSERGQTRDVIDYPANWGRFGTVGGGTSVQCTLFRRSTGACVAPADTVVVFAPLEAMSPFRAEGRGSRTKFGGTVSGGGDQTTYFLAGDREEELGVYSNNDLRRTSVRANVRARMRDDLEVTVTSGYVNTDIALPMNDNSLLGQLGGALLGSPIGTLSDAAGNQLFGYAAVTPRQMEQYQVRQSTNRLTGGLNANYRPLQWLSFVGQAGIDGLFRHDEAMMQPNTVFFGIWPQGFRQSNRARIVNLNTSLGGTASYALTPAIAGQTSAGVQYHRDVSERTDAYGQNLLFGVERLPGTTAEFSVDEIFTDNRTVGVYLQQQVAFNDRLFVTGALRGDDNSAFGSDFGLVVYPSLSTSWVVGEEPWFPRTETVSSLRLRAAVGSSGLRPSFRDAIAFYQPIGATVAGSPQPAFAPGGIGDPTLRPEFTTEVEAGFDAGFLRERVGLELTAYRKESRDALVFRRLAPSVGAPTQTAGAPGLSTGPTGRFENIGRVSNQGIEALLRLQPINTAAVRWDVTGTISTNRNRLEELGEGIEPILFGVGGNTQRHQPGYPLGGYWGRRLIGFEDANGDGIIQHTEVRLTSAHPDSLVYLGSPSPTREYTAQTSATLLDRVRVSALVDGKSGYMLNNYTRFFRCASAFVNCREAYDETAPLEDQARAIAASLGAREVYFEDASFTRLREVSVTLLAPPRLAQRMRVDGLSLTVSGRNLATWTSYTGFDPEVNWAAGENFSTAEFLTQPPLRYFTARIDLNF